MFVLANFIGAVAIILKTVINILIGLIVISAVISWVNPDPYNPIVQFLYRTTEPILRPIRRLIPIRGVPIDFSPMIAIIILFFLRLFVIGSLMDWSIRLK
ncbi:YggT family protein [bacterium]|nr:YggT family protein [bacterium]MBU4561599.1 YggT family protein [bacterium]MCG2678060.1 YggT family protein [bacterium]